MTQPPLHPIIAMWSHPRSMSTAIERIMRERGDLDCVHEPFMYDYYVHRKVRPMPHFEARPDHPATYADIRDMLIERAGATPVFFKDMSYYVMPHILADEGFCRRLVNVFLVRDPVASIPSYYRLDPEVSSEEIGLEAQWHHFDALHRVTGTAPVVIRAEDVRDDPEGIIGALWREIGLASVPEAFDWQREVPEDWAQVAGWHGDVTRSRGIRPMTAQEAAAQQEAFDALARTAPHLREYLAHHRPFYTRLAARALRP